VKQPTAFVSVFIYGDVIYDKKTNASQLSSKRRQRRFVKSRYGGDVCSKQGQGDRDIPYRGILTRIERLSYIGIRKIRD
jgi:hypothetical protein